MEVLEIREKIDTVDEAILQLFLERMALTEEVSRRKSEAGLPILNRGREREILARVTAEAGELEQYAYHLFTTLIQLSRSRQAELLSGKSQVAQQVLQAIDAAQETFPQTGKVACQGIEGGNSQTAADKLLPRGELVFVKNFEDVADAVESGRCQFGVLPFENSANGSVRVVYDLLQHRNLSVVRSCRLCIRHELLGLPGADLTQVRQIYSHPQAIGQCSRFLDGLEGVTVTPCGNTAAAAKLVADQKDPSIAALSSHGCAELYGLSVLHDDVQDSDNNYTRFFCVAKDPAIYAGANRISLIIACGDKPGALYDILSKPASLGINMTKLESCPVTGRNFEFIFFIELEADLRVPRVLSMLEEMERSCQSFHLLGSYAEI